MEILFVLSMLYEVIETVFIALILLAILIVMLWPKNAYESAHDFSDKVMLTVITGINVFFKLAGVLIFAFIAMILLWIGFVFGLGVLAALGTE